jgi:hypothetical protein
MVWTSDPVTWVSEYRFYVYNGFIIGEGRYDDKDDDAPLPDLEIIHNMVNDYQQNAQCPIAFSLDIGVLDSGETALIECNDAWALGFYSGSLSHDNYYLMLWERWQQIVKNNS